MSSNSPTEITRFGGGENIERPLGRSILRGLACTCPACGSGRLFKAFLKPVATCSACGEDLSHQRADDLPPYIVIMIVGHVLLGGYMMTDLVFALSTWVHLAIWVPIAVITSLLIIQPIKGSVIGLQWALRMHGFGQPSEPPEDYDQRYPPQ